MRTIGLGLVLFTAVLFGQEGVATTGRLTYRHPGSQKANGTRNFFITVNGVHVLPLVRDGGGWSTRVYLTNLENRDVRVFCDYVAQDGSAMVLETNIGRGDGAQLDLLRYGTFTFATNNTGATVRQGWIYCYADLQADRFGAHAVLRQEAADGQPARELAMPMLPDYEPKFVVPVADRGSFRNELLLVNTATETPSTIQVRLFTRDGETLMDPITLIPGEQRVINVNDQFPGVTYTSASLVVEVMSGTKFITGALLRQSDTGGPVSFIPLAEYIE